jgi:outer membrane receptor for ferrienterochelin and colicins
MKRRASKHGKNAFALALGVAVAVFAERGYAQDGGVLDGAPDAVSADSPVVPPAAVETNPSVPHVDIDDYADGQLGTLRQVLAGVDDITDLSLEALLSTGLTTSTKSKPMSIRDSPNVMSLITREEIVRSGARTLTDVLRLVPGVALNGDLYSSVFAGFRGIWGSEGKILILLDGHELFDLLYYATELGNRVPVDQIERIEIIRGPGSVIYGDAAELAVINIVTRSAADLMGATVVATYGQMFDGAIHQNQSLSDSFARRTVSAMFGNVWTGNHPFQLKAGLYLGQGNRSDQRFTDVNGDSYNLAGKARTDPMLFHASADYRGFKASYLFEYYRTTMRDGYGTVLADTLPVNYLSSSLRIGYAWQLAPGVVLTPHIHWLFQKPWQTDTEVARTSYPDIYWHPTARRLQGDLTLTWDVGSHLNLLLGADYHLDSATDDVGLFADPQHPDQTTPSVSYWDLTGFGQALLETEWVNLSAGARYQYRETVGGAFVPRAGATKTFGPFHFKLLYSRAFRTPSIANMARDLDIKSELTTVEEVELGYRLHPNLFAVVNGFNIDISRPFVYYYDDNTGLDGYRNYNRLGTRGCEIELRYKSDRRFADLSYSYYRAAGATDVDSLTVPGHSAVLLGFAPHKLAALVGATLVDRLDVSMSATLLAGSRFGYYAYDAAGAPVAKDYGAELLLNAYLSYSIAYWPGMFVGLGIYNLANARTQLIQAYDNGHAPLPGPSREIFVRVGYDYRPRPAGL